jgi:hypothetical protein
VNAVLVRNAEGSTDLAQESIATAPESAGMLSAIGALGSFRLAENMGFLLGLLERSPSCVRVSI